jgi:hypothetical protein
MDHVEVPLRHSDTSGKLDRLGAAGGKERDVGVGRTMLANDNGVDMQIDAGSRDSQPSRALVHCRRRSIELPDQQDR